MKKKINQELNENSLVNEEVLSPDCDIDASEFEWVGQDEEKMQAIGRPSVSFWKDAFGRIKKDKVAMTFIIFLVVLGVLSVLVPMLSPYTISEQHIEHTHAGLFFNAGDHMHIFGTDDLGRDQFTRIFYGARISLTIAFAAVFINVIVGVIYGGISGYFGGFIDNVMMRIVEIINGIPYLLIIILLSLIMEKGIMTIIIAYSLVGWVGTARLVRGQVISLKEQEYVISAKSMGASPTRIIAKHLVPNTLSVVIVNLTLAIPNAIFTEAFLSYIGLGVPVPLASMGTLANNGSQFFQQYPIELVIPALFISLTMLSFNLLGDKLRDAFDPKLRR